MLPPIIKLLHKHHNLRVKHMELCYSVIYEVTNLPSIQKCICTLSVDKPQGKSEGLLPNIDGHHHMF